ncbi:MAG: hypothetical protein SVZ03_03225 [Spirochaetota bacterium]|nr:hypothetical protein [Spirochaetota bacterium]
MDYFDGFIAAIASEFKIKFHKDKDDTYITNIEFDNNRTQEVLITLSKDESGDRIINYFSVIARLKRDSFELYKYSLKLNSTFDYGAMALLDETLILRDSILLNHCDPQQFMKTLTYIAAKADELEELFTKKNLY